MADRPAVHGYWEADGASKDFTHALDHELLAAYVPRDARVLDYGCGYGRLTARLAALGYGDVRGVDPSRAMVERGRREHPALDLAHQSALPLPRADGHTDGSYDAALLFVVLNCVPGDADQRAIVRELGRLLRPGGVLYVSDVPVQRDARNVGRYEQHAAHAPEGTPYGVFTTPDGGLFRHHPPGHVRELLHAYGFTVEEERTGTSATLHGHTAGHVQTIARRRNASRATP
ncbi:class I SAM-dependent methyltransferase [Streptomyces armeniacus]|uniref:Class I SAM-dependent methyltransferase n=1 Tax=Streptomyces armeniacus TaxID=83291 RepID=A0A345XZU5_9ACTN|nr:class I SAM-dependent methyltransferase [Streptomyces armeniacus]AXK37161.1 class I SAM-dependent methyltransferase [Streptomyces armeniacus]